MISVPKGHYIELEFKRFDIHKVGEGCGYDYVEIRDGNSRNSPSFGRRCGRTGNKTKNVNNIFGISSKSLLTIIAVDSAWGNNIFICVLLMRNPTVSTPSNQFL